MLSKMNMQHDDQIVMLFFTILKITTEENLQLLPTIMFLEHCLLLKLQLPCNISELLFNEAEWVILYSYMFHIWNVKYPNKQQV